MAAYSWAACCTCCPARRRRPPPTRPPRAGRRGRRGRRRRGRAAGAPPAATRKKGRRSSRPRLATAPHGTRCSCAATPWQRRWRRTMASGACVCGGGMRVGGCVGGVRACVRACVRAWVCWGGEGWRAGGRVGACMRWRLAPLQPAPHPHPPTHPPTHPCTPCSKAQLLDREAGDMAVRMALGEAQVIAETKRALGDAGERKGGGGGGVRACGGGGGRVAGAVLTLTLVPPFFPCHAPPPHLAHPTPTPYSSCRR